MVQVRAGASVSLRRRVQRGRGRSPSTLLLAQLLLKLRKLVHRDRFLLIHNLLNTLDLLNL